MRFFAQTSIGACVLALSTCASPAGADTLASGDPATLMTIEDFVSDLDAPTAFAFLPDGRLLITQKEGDLLLASADGSETEVIAHFDVDSGSEKGLLNVLVDPRFEENQRLFFYYSRAGGDSLDKHRVVSVRFENDSVDPSAETVLVSGLRGPANHDGGALAVSPDGQYLYIGVGDTGCNSGTLPGPNNPPTNYFGTCLTNGNGKILRVRLDGSIPPDNPLVGRMASACGSACGDAPEGTAPAREDIFAWGFRNPWRFWVDPSTGNLWVGDVGEVTYEEINVVPPAGGKHYGWPWREGTSGYPLEKCTEIEPDTGDCVDPVYHCGRGQGMDGGCRSITGGVIVDECTWPASLRNRYYFGDYSTGQVYSIAVNAARDGVTGARADFASSTGNGGPVHFAMGPDGALYYARLSGAIVRVAPQTPADCGGGGSGGTSGAGGSGVAGGTGGTGDASAGGGSSAAASGDDGGCGCRIAGGTQGSIVAALLALSGVAASLLRRRSKRSA